MPKNKPVPRSKFKRVLHIAGEEWRYQIQGSRIRFSSPENKKYVVDMATFTGWSWDELERAQWKGYYPQITPSKVKEYIEKFTKTIIPKQQTIKVKIYKSNECNVTITDDGDSL